MMFLVMVPNYWGRGSTPLAAANAARKVAGKRPAKRLPPTRIVFQYDPRTTRRAWVDDMGFLNWHGRQPERVETVGL